MHHDSLSTASLLPPFQRYALYLNCMIFSIPNLLLKFILNVEHDTRSYVYSLYSHTTSPPHSLLALPSSPPPFSSFLYVHLFLSHTLLSPLSLTHFLPPSSTSLPLSVPPSFISCPSLLYVCSMHNHDSHFPSSYAQCTLLPFAPSPLIPACLHSKDVYLHYLYS